MATIVLLMNFGIIRRAVFALARGARCFAALSRAKLSRSASGFAIREGLALSDLESLLWELRQLLLDSQMYFAQEIRSLAERQQHKKRAERMLEIKEQLAQMKKNCQKANWPTYG